MPAVLMAMWNWGLPAARVMALSMATCVVIEALCEKAMSRDLAIDDLSAVYAGLLFSFLLPAASPWWLVVIGATTCMTLGKMVFGGLGANPVSTPLVGWAVLAVSFPAVFTAVLFFLDFEVIGKIFLYFVNNPVMLVLLILSAVISAVFVCAGPVKVKNAILGIKRKDKH